METGPDAVDHRPPPAPADRIALGARPGYPARGAVERALDLLFPPLCVSCRRIGRWICAECWEAVSWKLGSTCMSCGVLSAGQLCETCGPVPSALRSVVAVGSFDGSIREAVHALKYEERHAIASTMGALMAQAATGIPARVVAAVSLHPGRRRQRGYDQAALLARVLGHRLGIATEAGLLQRTRATRQQVSLSAEERRRNVAGAFTARRSLSGDTVLLVDDVMTTGATMNAAAVALREAGAREVWGAVFAIATPGRDGPSL